MLTSMIAGVMPDPGEAAAEAAREWGRYLTEPQPPYQRLDAGQAIGKLTAALAEIEFAPKAVAEGGGCRLRSHQFPFLEVAERHQDVVCALHPGLMLGRLAVLRGGQEIPLREPAAAPPCCRWPHTRGGSRATGEFLADLGNFEITATKTEPSPGTAASGAAFLPQPDVVTVKMTPQRFQAYMAAQPTAQSSSGSRQ